MHENSVDPSPWILLVLVEREVVDISEKVANPAVNRPDVGIPVQTS